MIEIEINDLIKLFQFGVFLSSIHWHRVNLFDGVIAFSSVHYTKKRVSLFVHFILIKFNSDMFVLFVTLLEIEWQV